MKILYFVLSDNGRDIDMVMPLRYFLEEVLGHTFNVSYVFDWHQINRQKPDVIMLPNTIGAPIYFELSKFAYESGIPVFALDSEGHFRTDNIYNFWGHNKDKFYYQDYFCAWSNRTRDYLKVETRQADQIVTTGGLGFDVYSIYKCKSKAEYLKEHNLDYKYVVGYAAWAFGKVTSEKGRRDLISYFKGDETQLSKMEPQRFAIESMLRHAIENNPDTLFILKVHPLERKELFEEPPLNEISNLLGYENVIFEDENSKISDLMNVSDLWLSFESTTAIEAWALNKLTVLLQNDPDFSSSIAEKKMDVSQPIARNSEEVQAYIDEVKKTGALVAFDNPDREIKRGEVIGESVGFSDGYNHLRVVYFFMKTLERRKTITPKYRFLLKYYIRYILILIGVKFHKNKLFLKLPKVKKFLFIFKHYHFKDLHALYESRKPQFAEFYKKNRIVERFKSGELFDEIIQPEDKKST